MFSFSTAGCLVFVMIFGVNPFNRFRFFYLLLHIKQIYRTRHIFKNNFKKIVSASLKTFLWSLTQVFSEKYYLKNGIAFCSLVLHQQLSCLHSWMQSAAVASCPSPFALQQCFCDWYELQPQPSLLQERNRNNFPAVSLKMRTRRKENYHTT